jgi:hypothetical protein
LQSVINVQAQTLFIVHYLVYHFIAAILQSIEHYCQNYYLQLREFLPESMAIASMMSTFLEFFAEGRPVDYAETPAVQIEFCGLLLLLMDRVPCEPDATPLQEHAFYKKAPDRNARLEEFMARLATEQSKLDGLPEESKMRLPVPMTDPVDSRIFAVCSVTCYIKLASDT